jgi:hypothetical protein
VFWWHDRDEKAGILLLTFLETKESAPIQVWRERIERLQIDVTTVEDVTLVAGVDYAAANLSSDFFRGVISGEPGLQYLTLPIKSSRLDVADDALLRHSIRVALHDGSRSIPYEAQPCDDLIICR